jgi:hypothetical protein
MKKGSVVVPAVLVLLLALWCGPAAADPIQITGGSLQMTGLLGTLSLTGTRAFSLSAGVNVTDGVFQPWEGCHFAPVCVPGSSIDLGAVFTGTAVHGSATLGGRTFTNVGGLDSLNQSSVRFTGSVLAPAFDGDTATVFAPFQFQGSFANEEGMELLFGQGIATLFLRKAFGENEGLPDAWTYESARYDFTPTPEPATMLLTAAGLLGLAERRRRSRRNAPIEPGSRLS